MNQLVLPVNPGTIPQGVCPTGDGLQSLLNLFAQYMSVTFPNSFSGVSVGGSPPTDTTQAWMQTDSLGRPVRFYIFAQGTWLSQHPLPPGVVMIYPFTTPDFTTFDGGDANALSTISGPMWQIPTVDGSNTGTQILQAQVPLGTGTLPSGKIITPTLAGGEENHILSTAEMPPHTHSFPQFAGNNVQAQGQTAVAGGGIFGLGSLTAITQSTGGDPTTGNPPTASAGHNNMPPYVGVTFLQRTTRLFYATS